MRMVAEATGRTPLTYESSGQVIITVPRGEHPAAPERFGRFTVAKLPVGDVSAECEPPRDDWPFLYLAGRQIPFDYLIVICTLLTI